MQDISKGKVGSTEIKESVVIIMGALVHKLCQKGGCNLPVSSAVKTLNFQCEITTPQHSNTEFTDTSLASFPSDG